MTHTYSKGHIPTLTPSTTLSFIKQWHQVSCTMRKPIICICENKDADQLRGNCEADQRICFRYTDSTIALLLKFEI